MTTSALERKPFRLPFGPAFLIWLGFLAVLLLIGVYSAITVFINGLYITNMSDSVPWGLWITIDLSSIALGAGAFTLSAIVYIFGIKNLQSIIRLAVLVGFAGYTSALLMLVVDIGRPDRFWHPWVYWNVHSVLWEVTMCITIYLLILVTEFAPVMVETKFFDRWPAIRKFAHFLHKFTPFLAVFGLVISLLHQSSLGAAYGVLKSRPIWFKPSMPIMFVLSAIAAGPAVTVAVAYVLEWVTGKRTVPHDVLRLIARFCGVGLLAYGYIKFWDMAAVTYYGRTPGVSSAFALLQQQTPYNFSFWVGEVILGILVPAFLFLVPRFNKNPAAAVLGAFSAMIGIILHRWNVTVGGLYVPISYSPGTAFELPAGTYFPAAVEWGVGILVIGYALTVLTLGARFLPLFEKNEH
ncbi:MAG: polysulfide reductase NrfD [Anaerolineales bacterium]|nr:polysulfide reductase NrfD [Anaerolineales bacterium]